MRKEDKNNLIIVGVMVIFVALVAVLYYGTMHIPLKWIGAIFMVLPFVQIAMITKSYFEVYRVQSNVWAIPVLNTLNSAPRGAAIAFTIAIIFAAVYAIAWLVPSGLLAKISFDAAFNVPQMLYAWLPFVVTIVYITFGVANDMIWADIRSLLYEATGESTPKLCYIYYILMLFPVLNVLALTQVDSDVAKLKRLGFHVGDSDEDVVLEEV